MNIIIRKVRMIAPPMTVCTFTPTAEAPCAGIYLASLADGHDSVTIDWGDGSVECVSTVKQLIHTYTEPGTYTATISDDIRSIAMSAPRPMLDFVKTCAGQLRAFKSTATLLANLTQACFAYCPNLVTFDISATPIRALTYGLCRDCTALTGRLDFPNAAVLTISGSTLTFTGCTSPLEIHFAEANRAAIESSAAYQTDQKLGAANAVVKFDL